MKRTTVDNIYAQSDLIDPEPLSIFLAILGAIGSFASIVSYIESQRENKRRTRIENREQRAELTELIIGIEASVLEMEGQIYKLEMLTLFGGLTPRPSQIGFIFGGAKPVYNENLYK